MRGINGDVPGLALHSLSLFRLCDVDGWLLVCFNIALVTVFLFDVALVSLILTR